MAAHWKYLQRNGKVFILPMLVQYWRFIENSCNKMAKYSSCQYWLFIQNTCNDSILVREILRPINKIDPILFYLLVKNLTCTVILSKGCDPFFFKKKRDFCKKCVKQQALFVFSYRMTSSAPSTTTPNPNAP